MEIFICDILQQNLNNTSQCKIHALSNSFFLRPLPFNLLYGEKRYGLASTLEVNCPHRGTQNTLSSSTSHRASHIRPKAFDVNTRAALGALHASAGHTHLSAITSTLNIPSMSRVTFKAREREIGLAWESVAQSSCKKFIEAEKENVLEVNEPAIFFHQFLSATKKLLSIHTI